MKFTNILLQVNYHRHFQRIWKRQGRFQVPELTIPKELQEMGVMIKDAKEILRETQRFPKVTSVALKPKPPSVLSQPKYYFIMNEQTQISESENQLLCLTKSVPYKILPDRILPLIGTCSLQNQEELVANCVRQAHEWEGDQDKLPKIVDPEMPGYVFKRAYGTFHSKKVLGLLERLSHLGDMAIGKYPSCLERNKVHNAYSELEINRGGDNITLQMPCDILLTSSKPLPMFSKPDEVSSTKDIVVPDIYPIKPTLDLDKSEQPVERRSIPHMAVERHLHTILLAHKFDEKWSMSEMLGRSIGTCFTFTAQQALMQYGPDVKLLPKPICVQCVLVNGQNLHFMAYQLNTLDLITDDGIKNQVWWEENETHATEAFPKFLAFYVNGLA